MYLVEIMSFWLGPALNPMTGVIIEGHVKIQRHTEMRDKNI